MFQDAPIKEEYLLPVIKNDRGDGEPEDKRAKLEDGQNGEKNKSKNKKPKNRGQNKDRPAPFRDRIEDKICAHLYDGESDEPCPRSPNCSYIHDVKSYLENKKKLPGKCVVFETYGKCKHGMACLFSESHTVIIDGKIKNQVNEELWEAKKSDYEKSHKNLLNYDLRDKLRKKRFDFKDIDKLIDQLSQKKNQDLKKTSGTITDEDEIKIRKEEIKKLDFNDKLYLSPLTTVGNLPFRRLCVEMGADITCGEMSLASSIVKGSPHEFALHRRFETEKMFGVQICANNAHLAAKASKVLIEAGVDFDFIDLNCGCPLDPIIRMGAGSGLMGCVNKFKSIVNAMTASSFTKPFTVKMRTGIKSEKNTAHSMIEMCKNAGVSLVTLHGRSREQRYTKTANWDYIGECVKVASPMPLFGNGDILTWEQAQENKNSSGVAGLMIGRGALIKPWIFQEIKESRHIDLSSTERLELLQKYCNYGLDHWGSDTQGIETTRRFFLEFQSFFHRYVPYGILYRPAHINERPAKYRGRDEMETLLASTSSEDWIKLSERILGKVPDRFAFLPKHKSNAWSNG